MCIYLCAWEQLEIDQQKLILDVHAQMLAHLHFIHARDMYQETALIGKCNIDFHTFK